MGTTKFWLRFYEWVASELGAIEGVWGQASPIFGVWFPGCLAHLGRDHFFIFSCGIVGITDFGLPFWNAENWLLLFWIDTFAGDMT